ncbi:hypothetical protein [Halorubrum trueperi]|uniref:MBL fold metallo-hydrolase n=1 Tax=Halorubrum trueperi TaxID=2004704 RepID=A0ABD5UMQ2_9EURY
MPLKADGEADLHEIDRFEGGVGWIAYPQEGMERASHAIAVPNAESETDDVWLFDPVDAPGLDDLLAELGTVAGVVVGFDRHRRDSAAIATRHEAAVHVTEWMTGVADELNAPVERFGSRLADSGFEAFRIRVSSLPPWQEVGFFDGETLIVPESLGSASYFRGARERLGVHPMLRLTPPIGALSGLNPERVLVGHGVGVHDRAAIAVEDALSGSRRKAPGLYAKALRSALGI